MPVSGHSARVPGWRPGTVRWRCAPMLTPRNSASPPSQRIGGHQESAGPPGGHRLAGQGRPRPAQGLHGGGGGGGKGIRPPRTKIVPHGGRMWHVPRCTCAVMPPGGAPEPPEQEMVYTVFGGRQMVASPTPEGVPCWAPTRATGLAHTNFNGIHRTTLHFCSQGGMFARRMPGALPLY